MRDPLHYLWHPDAYRVLDTLMGPHDPDEPYTVERVLDGAATVVERYGRPCEAAWAADWLAGTRTAVERAAGLVYRVGGAGGAS